MLLGKKVSVKQKILYMSCQHWVNCPVRQRAVLDNWNWLVYIKRLIHNVPPWCIPPCTKCLFIVQMGKKWRLISEDIFDMSNWRQFGMSNRDKSSTESMQMKDFSYFKTFFLPLPTSKRHNDGNHPLIKTHHQFDSWKYYLWWSSGGKITWDFEDILFSPSHCITERYNPGMKRTE